jgi:hypothetical protein
MDRLKGALVLMCGLGLVASGSGCRSTHSEVPPGRKYMQDGRQMPPVGFSTEPHPATSGGGFPNGAPGSLPSATGSMATPPLGAGSYGAPTDHGYGPPATNYTPPTGSSGGIPLPGSAASLGGLNPGVGPNAGGQASQ